MYFSIIVSCYRFVTSDCLAIHIQSWFSKWSFSLLLLNICGIDDSFLSICKKRQKVIQRELLMFGHQCKADWLCYIYYFKKQSTCFKNYSSLALCINFIVICIKFYQVFDFPLRTYQGVIPYFSNLFSFHTLCTVQYASEKDTNKMSF